MEHSTNAKAPVFFRRADATTQMVALGCQKGGEVKLVVLRASLF